ncbi:papilin-like isoform X1 [Styela clava]
MTFLLHIPIFNTKDLTNYCIIIMKGLKLNYGFIFLACFCGFFLGSTIAANNPYCSYPKDRGPCKAAIDRYYFNFVTKKCEMFPYGGCKGNGNNFRSIGECQQECIEVCEQPKEQGPCEAAIQRYFYNTNTRMCELFRYGGCQGNDNNFASALECERKCTNICLLPADKGPCEGLEKRYFFDKARGMCSIFTYGGCEGNSNNFMSLKDCRKTCRDMNPHCLEPKGRGEKVDKYEVRWMYESAERKCVPFVYGGKGGNNNNYMTNKECKEKCPIDDMCKMEMEVGSCDRNLERWYYDYIDEKCKQFAYGGCFGNSNNFKSKLECERKCPLKTESVCSMLPDEGPCDKWEPRYYFDDLLKKCNLLVYGGCGGNANNFFTMDDCNARCPEEEEDICLLPKDLGDGGKVKDENVEPMDRYYYDSEKQKCQYFQYSGSGGNANNFRSSRQCQLHCPLKSRCAEPLKRGSNGKSDLRWYFNIETLECELFVYEGAGGNKNNFDSKRECQNTCWECDKASDSGFCNGLNRRWAYDASSKKCNGFIYGGCEGNANRFKSLSECDKKCK